MHFFFYLLMTFVIEPNTEEHTSIWHSVSRQLSPEHLRSHRAFMFNPKKIQNQSQSQMNQATVSGKSAAYA